MVADGNDAGEWGDAAAEIQRELRAAREAFGAAWAVVWGPMPLAATAPFASVMFEDRDLVQTRGSALGMAVPVVGNPWAERVLATGGGLAVDAQVDASLVLHAPVIKRNAVAAIASAAYQRDGETWAVVEVYGLAPLLLPDDPLGTLRRTAERVAEIVRNTPPRHAESPAPVAPPVVPPMGANDPMMAAALHDLKSALAAQTLLVASFEKEVRSALARPASEPSRLGSMLESLGVLRESVAHANELARVMTLGALAPTARVQIDLPGLVRLALAAIAPDLRERFALEVADELRELGAVPSAPALLRAIHNLVQNAAIAIQRNPAARGTVRLRSERGGVLIEVEDEGPGVPAGVLDRLFQPGATTREQSHGHGFGLYSARQTVESLGGTLTLYSVPQRGARFTIRLPSQAAGL